MTAKKQAAPAARPHRIEPLTRLATGGMADIWLARELGPAGLERFVVVKRPLPHLARDPEFVAMFVSEARFVARLVHPNVVQIHELGEDDQGYFLVMEYVAGCSVRELVSAASKAERKLPPGVAVCVVEQACRGAHAAHELTDAAGRPLGLVHRDISPHNLMIGPQGDVKLLDFGIAKATKSAEATSTGTLKGKQGYMSPEQVCTTRVDRRSDVFALGIVCWELLTGERLFKRETDFATMEAITDGDVRLVTEVRSDVPPAFDAVVARALETDLEARWQTADEFRHALIGAAEESGVVFSRDALAADVKDLLSDKLAQREEALRNAATLTAHLDLLVLQDALAHSETSMDRPEEQTSRTGSEDVATVAQRRETSPATPPPGEAAAVENGEPASVRRGEPEEEDDVTRIGQHEGEPVATAQVEAPETSKGQPLRPTRPALRIVLTLVLLAGVAGAVALFAGQSRDAVTPGTTPPSPASSTEPPPSGPVLRFAVAPTLKPEVMRRELAPFLRWLGGVVDRPVELSIADSYEQSADLVTSGRAQFGLFPPLLFVTTFAREPRLQPLAVQLYDGSRANDGYLLVRDDAPVASAADLKGRTVCHVDRTSTTGFLLPRIWMRKAGLDPDKDVRVVMSGDHLAAMRDLSSGRCDAATVYSGAYLSARKEGIAVGTLRMLAVTGRVPADMLAATPDMPAAEVERLRAALLGFRPQRDIDAGGVGEVLGISGFGAFYPAEFDTIREAAEQEGIVDQSR